MRGGKVAGGVARPAVKLVERLGFPYATESPFLFAVHHKDLYPKGDAKMQAPRRGNGADFDWSQPYRMYHGDRVPGFPQHPHRGFETITCTMEGFCDHTDSMGSAGRYGEGDLQWMTAGKGIVHGEMFPLINTDKPNTMRLFQLWINLPAKSKMVDPAFVMHWAERIPVLSLDQGRAKVTVWAGELMGETALKPPKDSWATTPENEVAVWLIELAPGGEITLPPASGGDAINRNIYFFEGDKLSAAGRGVPANHRAKLAASAEAHLVNRGASPASILLMQGRPIDEPVAKHGPFVMNTQEEIQQAFMDYSATQFGGWPWDSKAPIFARDKGRFALCGGKEERPEDA